MAKLRRSTGSAGTKKDASFSEEKEAKRLLFFGCFGNGTSLAAAGETLQEVLMTQPRFDICGIGNAIVDVVAPAEHGFLSKHDMHPGSMTLIDAARAEALYAAMPPGQESSGGSVANTCAVAAGLGARVAYLGKVADDKLGHVFRDEIAAAGVHFPSTPLTAGAPTARCLILVTPDGQRTMNTFLGACVAFGEADVDTALIADSAVLYLEGYLFDPPAAQAAFRAAARAARAAHRSVALSLSDAFCVNRHRAAFCDLLADVDILFANEAEICSLFETNTFDDAAHAARQCVKLAALTRSEDGSLVVSGADMIAVQAVPTRLVDSTGAGDAYAAGFLAAYTAGRDLAACGRLGSLAAAEVISHYGARPERDLKPLLNEI
jgi:sugar/nucleoside kinase (ribokinase family)